MVSLTTIEEMKHLGFTGAEAQVYIFLLQNQLATGYEISKGTGLPRANVYQALETLTSKERVTVVSTEPARYAPLSPERLLKRIQEETEQRCQILKQQLSEIEKPDSAGHFWEINERDGIETRVKELINAARHRVAAILWAEDLARFADPLRAAHERGCTVIVNLFGEADADYAIVYQHEEPEQAVGGHTIALTIDYQEVLLASLDTPETGVLTQNRTLVRTVEKLIRDEAYLAAIYEHLPDELERSFGPHMVHLRRGLLPEQDAEHLLAITTAQSYNKQQHETVNTTDNTPNRDNIR
ncbi:TrmB family transcriptional regulator [Ktedonobacteria bacterium brp13]|nr:TrmB family transcriptional regulator [Ktedonobacteria bacterium brp13]